MRAGTWTRRRCTRTSATVSASTSSMGSWQCGQGKMCTGLSPSAREAGPQLSREARAEGQRRNERALVDGCDRVAKRRPPVRWCGVARSPVGAAGPARGCGRCGEPCRLALRELCHPGKFPHFAPRRHNSHCADGARGHRWSGISRGTLLLGPEAIATDGGQIGTGLAAGTDRPSQRSGTRCGTGHG